MNPGIWISVACAWALGAASCPHRSLPHAVDVNVTLIGNLRAAGQSKAKLLDSMQVVANNAWGVKPHVEARSSSDSRAPWVPA